MRHLALSMAAVVALSGSAMAAGKIRITEWMYSGNVGEFTEFTNVGNQPVDMTGWFYDDEDAIDGETYDLSGFGIVMPGQSVILTEADAAAFSAEWGLAGVVVLGGVTNNLGRNDAINLFNASSVRVDSLDYGDQEFVGSIRTQNRSGSPLSSAALGDSDPYQWGFSDSGAGGLLFWTSATGNTGNPGVAIPTPGAALLAGIGGLSMLRRRAR